MAHTSNSPRRVLIASANPLFRDGLQNEYAKRWGADVRVVGMPKTLEETLTAMEALQPDLVIVDHDDVNINRAEFLNRFISGQSTIKVVLVSLNEAGQVVIYDRRQLDHAQADVWLSDPWQDEPENRNQTLERRSNMRHFVILAVLVVSVAVLTYVGLDAIGLLPVQASAQAVVIDSLLDLQMKVISFLFALIAVPIVYSLVVFRRKPGETGDGVHFEGNSKLEVAWTVIPLFIVVAFAYIGAENLAETRRVDPNAMKANVVGIRWQWTFEYPEYGFTSRELHLVDGKQVLLSMTAPEGDVIHSFWVPEFRIKQDVVPGRVTEYRVTPILAGQYKVRCAELCGTSHSYMESAVIVESQAEFDAWVKTQQAAAADAAANLTPEERGQKLVTEKGCVVCHSLDGQAGVGPTWQGLFGGVVELNDGTTLTRDEAYLAESIKDPNAQIVKGYQANGMPQFGFTDAQIADLVAYLIKVK